MKKGKKDAAPSYVSERDEKLADKVEQYNVSYFLADINITSCIDV